MYKNSRMKKKTCILIYGCCAREGGVGGPVTPVRRLAHGHQPLPPSTNPDGEQNIHICPPPFCGPFNTHEVLYDLDTHSYHDERRLSRRFVVRSRRVCDGLGHPRACRRLLPPAQFPRLRRRRVLARLPLRAWRRRRYWL